MAFHKAHHEVWLWAMYCWRVWWRRSHVRVCVVFSFGCSFAEWMYIFSWCLFVSIVNQKYGKLLWAIDWRRSAYTSDVRRHGMFSPKFLLKEPIHYWWKAFEVRFVFRPNFSQTFQEGFCGSSWCKHYQNPALYLSWTTFCHSDMWKGAELFKPIRDKSHQNKCPPDGRQCEDSTRQRFATFAPGIERMCRGTVRNADCSGKWALVWWW